MEHAISYRIQINNNSIIPRLYGMLHEWVSIQSEHFSHRHLNRHEIHNYQLESQSEKKWE